MTKTNTAIDERLRALNEHPFGKDSKRDEAILIEALASKHARVVAKAAEIAGERLCYVVTSTLKDAYRRFLDDPVKKDPQCLAKQASVRALVALDCMDANVYLAGIRYRQLEPVWGGSADTAVDIRASSAMGLVNSGYPRALQELTTLLNDTEVRARSGAVRAIACGKPNEAELLLRFKILVGDAEPEVIGESYSALLTIAGIEAVPLIAEQLRHRDEALSEYAAIALGESQLPEALVALRSAWETALVNPTQKRVLTRAAALHRSDGAFDWLVSLLLEGSRSAAEAALEALSIYKENARLTERVKAALDERGDAKLVQVFVRAWC